MPSVLQVPAAQAEPLCDFISRLPMAEGGKQPHQMEEVYVTVDCGLFLSLY